MWSANERAAEDRGREAPRRPTRSLVTLSPPGLDIDWELNGPEFGRAFGEACRAAGVRHHRIPPRSPNLNAFVERFQGTVLHLHYRVAFRYRYYTRIETIDADLQAWLRFYNFERPHRGYRTRGRVPASIFFNQQPQFLEQMGA